MVDNLKSINFTVNDCLVFLTVRLLNLQDVILFSNVLLLPFHYHIYSNILHIKVSNVLFLSE